MIITEIKKIGKGERYSLYINGIFNCTLQDEILVKEKLKTGDEISEDRLSEIKIENGRIACFSHAISYIEKGIHTQKQVREYLKEKGYLRQSIDEAIDKLNDYGYLSDEYYAEAYVNTNKARKGRRKLKFELMQKGVSGEIAESKLNELLDDDESEQACRRLAEKYLKGRIIDQKLHAKLYNHLASKGYESSIILKVISEVENASGD